ncbi:protein kinase domain-containing protein [Streptomyces sp. NBC_00588]|uniref:serine/threonine-protein kinase n=1 Tax=Streptomyces sp. NBC_00588 TaxID=2975784 RepID=UPI003FCDADD9
MGRVWRAADEMLDRPVAVKEMRIDGLDAEDARTRRERTLREARATARIDHPNVVRVYDVVDEGERLWIVMELVAGRSLERIMAEEGPLGTARTARIGLGLVAALRQVHDRGVLHRDIKPGNVLVEEGGERIVLTDFGIAAIQDAKALTMVGMLVGSPDYMAPERISGRPQGPPSDVWSLGATLCAALGGRSPFSRDTTLATLHAVLYEEPQLPAAAGPLRDVLAALLEKEPTVRPGLDDLQEALLPIAFPPTKPTLPVGGKEGEETPVPPEQRPSGTPGTPGDEPTAWDATAAGVAGGAPAARTGEDAPAARVPDGSTAATAAGPAEVATAAEDATAPRTAKDATVPRAAADAASGQATVEAAAASAAEAAAGVRAAPGEGVRGEPGAGAQVEPGAGAQAVPGAGVRAAPGAGVQAAPGVGAQDAPGAGAQAVPGAGVRAVPGAGVQAVPGAGAQDAPGAGAQAVPGAGVRAVPGAGAQAVPGAGAQAEPGAGAQAEPGAGVRAVPGAGAQAEPGAGVRAVPGADAQAEPGAYAQAEPGAGTEAPTPVYLNTRLVRTARDPRRREPESEPVSVQDAIPQDLPAPEATPVAQKAEAPPAPPHEAHLPPPSSASTEVPSELRPEVRSETPSANSAPHAAASAPSAPPRPGVSLIRTPTTPEQHPAHAHGTDAASATNLRQSPPRGQASRLAEQNTRPALGPHPLRPPQGELPGPAEPSGPRHPRRRAGLVAGVGLVAAGAVVAAVLLTNSGSPGDDGAGPSASSASTPSPTVEGTSRPQSLPPGAHRETGFAWATPEGWRRDVKTGAEVHYTSPDGTQELVAKSSIARGDLMETWQKSEQNAHQGENYQKIRLERTTFRGNPAVVWEYTFTLKGTPWHARLLGFNQKGRSYQINTWYQPEVESQALKTYGKVRDSFTVL